MFENPVKEVMKFWSCIYTQKNVNRHMWRFEYVLIYISSKWLWGWVWWLQACNSSSANRTSGIWNSPHHFHSHQSCSRCLRFITTSFLYRYYSFQKQWFWESILTVVYLIILQDGINMQDRIRSCRLEFSKNHCGYRFWLENFQN